MLLRFTESGTGSREAGGRKCPFNTFLVKYLPVWITESQIARASASVLSPKNMTIVAINLDRFKRQPTDPASAAGRRPYCFGEMRADSLTQFLTRWISLVFCLSLGACALHPGNGQLNASNDLDEKFSDGIKQSDVVYVGETHDDPAHHQYELELVRGLLNRKIKFALGWEMFDGTQQSSIDAWESHSISLNELLAKTGFDKSWGVYSPVYAQILELTEKARVKNVALNAAPELVQKIARGMPLSTGEQAMLPNGFVSNEQAFNHFLGMMGGHPGLSELDQRRFFAAQNVWDQTMARRILEFKRRTPTVKLVVFAGRGHVSDGYGIPFYVKQKANLRQLVLLPKGRLDLSPGQKAI